MERRTVFDEQVSAVEGPLGACDRHHFCVRRLEIDICIPSRTGSHNAVQTRSLSPSCMSGTWTWQKGNDTRKEERDAPHVLARHPLDASHRHMHPRDRPHTVKERPQGVLRRPKRQVAHPNRVLTSLAPRVVRYGCRLVLVLVLALARALGVVLDVGCRRRIRRAIVTLVFLAWGVRGRNSALLLFLFLLSASFGV